MLYRNVNRILPHIRPLRALYASTSTQLSASSVPSLSLPASHDDSKSVFVPLYSLLKKEIPKEHKVDSNISKDSTSISLHPLSSRPPLQRAPRLENSEHFVSLSAEVFDHPIRRDILHLALVHHLDGQRQGSASTKSRYEVRGSKRKLFRQKGTGRARVGDAQSPIRRGGGVVFGPKPRSFKTKLPRKVIRMAMRVAFSGKVREGGLMVVDSLNWTTCKTRILSERLDHLEWNSSKLLIVTGMEAFTTGLSRSSHNLENVEAKLAEEVTIHDILRYPRIVLDLAAVDFYEQRLSRNSTLPEPDSRPTVVHSSRQLRRQAAEVNASTMSTQLTHLQYKRRFGRSPLPLPGLPRRMLKDLTE